MAKRFLSNVNINDQYTLPSSDGTSGQIIQTDGAGSLSFIDNAADEARKIIFTVKNKDSISLSKGTVVHASPSANPPSGNIIEVIRADSNNSSKMPAIGVLNETLAVDAEGECVMLGSVSGIATNSFSIGDELYVSTTAGEFTATKPTATTEEVQKIAIVIKSHSTNGLIEVFGAGRSNDVPNLLTRNISIDGADFHFGNADQVRMGGTFSSPGLRLQHNGSNSFIDTEIGNMYFRAEANDSDMAFQADDGNGGNANYFYLDGSLATHNGTNTTQTVTVFPDNSKIQLGDDANGDFRLFHNGTNSVIANNTGNIEIINYSDDKDIFLKSDDGSGGVTTYYYIDGSEQLNRFQKGILIPDNVHLSLGNSFDLKIYHDGSNSFISDVGTGNLNIQGSIVAIESTSGENYFVGVENSYSAIYYDNSIKLQTTSSGIDVTGNTDTDGITSSAEIDVNLASEGTYFEGGSGNIRRLTITTGTNASAHALHTFNIASSNGKYEFDVNGTTELSLDSSSATFASKVQFTSSADYIDVISGDLYIVAGSGKKNILYSNNVEALRLDTSQNATLVGDLTVSGGDIILGGTGRIQGIDTVSASTDAASKAYVDAAVGGQDTLAEILAIGNTTGGTDIAVSAGDDVTFADNSIAFFGAGNDFYQYHDGSNSYIKNYTGDLTIEQNANNNDIIFKSDDGAGGVADYFVINGTVERNIFYKDTKHPDGVVAYFGNGDDLQIYHDGSNSYVRDLGAGNLYIDTSGNQVVITTNATAKTSATFTNNAGVELYYDAVKKFETTSTGVTVTGTAKNNGIEVESGVPTILFDETDVTANWRNRVQSGTYKVQYASNGSTFSDILNATSSGVTVTGIVKSSGNGASFTFEDRVNSGNNWEWFSANNNAGLYKNHNTAETVMTIDSAGQVGIGTTSPDVRLEVIDASPTDGIIADFVNSTNAGGTTAAIKLSNADSEACDVVLGANRVGANFGSDFFISLSDSTDGTNQERFRITEAGNVGIGTTSPTNLLHIKKTGFTRGTFEADGDNQVGIQIIRSNSSNNTNWEIYSPASSTDLRFFNGGDRVTLDSSGNVDITGGGLIKGMSYLELLNNGGSIPTATSPRLYSPASGTLAFSGNGSERMRITHAGNVGIGTTSPDTKLEVVKDVDNSTNIGTDGNATQILHNGNASGTAVLKLRGTASNSGAIVFGGGLGASTDKFNIISRYNNTKILTAGANGNVGIGTDSPTDYYTGADNLVVYQASGEAGITVATATNTTGSLYFADGTTGDAEYRGGIFYNHSTDELGLVSGGASRVTLDSSGNLGIGLTNTNSVKLGITGNSGLPATSGTTQTGLLRLKASNNATLDMGADHTTANGWLQVTDVTDLSAEYNLLLQPNGGNVGIGTSSPSTELHVKKDSNVRLRLETTNTGTSTIQFADSDDVNIGIIQYDHSVDAMYFDVNNTERMRITSAGNVGIGTTNPQENLHIADASDGIPVFRLEGGSRTYQQFVSGTSFYIRDVTASSNRIVLNSSGDVLLNSGVYLSWGTTGAASIEGSTVSNKLQFRTNSADAMIIDSSQNVGIGTTSPEEKLDVTGSVLISNNEFYKVENTSGTNYKIAGLTSGNEIQIGAIDYTTAGTIFAGGDNISITTGGASGTTRVKIDSSGNVGINTTSPSEKLTVNGNIESLDTIILKNSGGHKWQQLFQNTNDFVIRYNNTSTWSEKMRIDSSGNVGINGASNFGSDNKAIQLINGVYSGAFQIDSIGNVGLAQNAYQDGSWKYYQTNEAAILNLEDGQFKFFNAASGTADTNITFSQRMHIANDGKVGIGLNSSLGYKLNVAGSVYASGDFIVDTFGDTYRIGADTYTTDQVSGVMIRPADNGNPTAGDVLFVVRSGGGSPRLFVEHSGTTGTSNPIFTIGASSTRANGNVVLSSNSSSYFNGGNVGIGTTSPQRLLHLRSTNEATGIFLERSSNYGFVQYNEIVGSVETYHLGFVNNNTFSSDILVANESGNVGIGTDSPDARFSVVTATANSTASRIGGLEYSGTQRGLTIKTFQSAGGDDCGVEFNAAEGLSGYGSFIFKADTAERMVIDSSGNVQLQTVGAQLRFQNSAGAAPYIKNSGEDASTAPYGQNLEFYTGGSKRLTIDNSGNTTFAGKVSLPDNQYLTWTGSNTRMIGNSDYLIFQVAASDKMAILSSGNVGIGTTSPIGSLNISKDSTTDGLSQAITISSSTTSTKRMNLGYVPGSNYSFIDTINYGINNTDQALSLQPNGGNVGIGTTSTGAAKLYVNQTEGWTGTQYAIFANTYSVFGNLRIAGNDAARSVYQQNDANLGIGTQHNRDINFFTNTSSTRMTITGGGNVGIGTTTPSGKLNVFGATGLPATSGTTFTGTMRLQVAGYGTTLDFGAEGPATGKQWLQATDAGDLSITYPLLLNPNGGNVGIGTTSPTGKFNSYISATRQLTHNGNGGDLSIISDNNSSPVMFIKGTGSADLLNVFDNTTEVFTILDGGDVGIGDTTPSYKLDVAGVIRATGDIIAFSDKRVKENIKTIDNSLEKVDKLRGVEFNKIGEDKKSIGVIAQEIEEILPEVVSTDDDGMKSVAYGNITGVLIEAIKELKQEIEILKTQINK